MPYRDKEFKKEYDRRKAKEYYYKNKDSPEFKLKRKKWGTVGIPIRLRKELREFEKGLGGTLKKGFPTLIEHMLKLSKNYARLKKEYYILKNKLDLIENDK